jgi:hypothetical protein
MSPSQASISSAIPSELVSIPALITGLESNVTSEVLIASPHEF